MDANRRAFHFTKPIFFLSIVSDCIYHKRNVSPWNFVFDLPLTHTQTQIGYVERANWICLADGDEYVWPVTTYTTCQTGMKNNNNMNEKKCRFSAHKDSNNNHIIIISLLMKCVDAERLTATAIGDQGNNRRVDHSNNEDNMYCTYICTLDATNCQ